MQVFISSTSSILSTAVIEFLFNSGYTIHSCPHLNGDDTQIKTTLQEKIGHQRIDIVLLMADEEVFLTANRKSKVVESGAKQIKIKKSICEFFANRSIRPVIIMSLSSLSYCNYSITPCTEKTPKGIGFLAEHFSQLEDTIFVSADGIRTVHLRLGDVISRSHAPAFVKFPIFKNKVPTFFRDKVDLISWVSQEDAVRAIHFICINGEISGPVNIVCGDSVAKEDFKNSIAKKFRLKKTLPLPQSVTTLIFGKEIASLFTISSRAIPQKLMEAGFLFHNISLSEYLCISE
jgi:hypothetical protein